MRSVVVGFIVLGVFSAVAEEDPSGGITNFLFQGAQEVMKGAESGIADSDDMPEGELLVLDAGTCVELAINQNAQALIALAGIEESQAGTGIALSAALPQVTARSGYTLVQGLDTEIYGSGLAKLLFQVDDFATEKGTWTSQLGVEQVLYAGGQIRAAISASKHLKQSQEWKYHAVVNELAYQAKQAFYDGLLSRALVEVAQGSVDTFNRHVADVKNMLEVGMASQFEVLRAETELRARETTVIAAQSAEKLALLNLRRILALPDNGPIELDGALEWVPVNTPIQDLVAQAIVQRPEIHALDKALTAARDNIRGRKGAYHPKAAASAQWQMVDGGGRLMPDGWTFTVGVEWDIFAGGKRKHDVLEAEAQYKNLQYQRKELHQIIELDVRQAHIRVQEAIAKIRRESSTLDLAKEGLNLAELRFQQGAGIQADTLDAELALKQAKTTMVKALRDYAVAIASLDRALGKPDSGDSPHTATDNASGTK